MSAKEGLESQAKKMLKFSNLKFPSGKVGDTVKLRVPDVDRAGSDPRNLLAVILEVQNEEFYQLGTKQGRLLQLYTRNQFTICEEQFILLDDVPDLAISLRECVRKSSLSGGQGYQRCDNGFVMTETSTSRGCSFKLGLHVVDCVALLLVIVLQGSILDYYLILHNGGSAAWYFWFLADFLVLIAFMAAAVISYRHYQKKGRLRKPGDVGDALHMTGALPPPRQGSLPLSYVTWFFYSSLLTAKVVLLFKLDVAQTLEKDYTFGPQLLKIVIASAAIVFLLLVETHNDSEPHSDHQAYIYFLITSTVFEILDSVTFLGILFPSESKLILVNSLENAILGLSCVNFVLPTLALYKLSVSEFGLHARPLGLQLLYKLLHLVLINVPYLAVRIYLWTLYDQNVTLFVLKNILAIFLALRTTFPDIPLWWQIFQESRRKHQACLDGAMELGVVYETAEEQMEEVNFGKDVPKQMENTQL